MPVLLDQRVFASGEDSQAEGCELSAERFGRSRTVPQRGLPPSRGPPGFGLGGGRSVNAVELAQVVVGFVETADALVEAACDAGIAHSLSPVGRQFLFRSHAVDVALLLDLATAQGNPQA